MSVHCHYCNYLPDGEYLCDPKSSDVCQPCKELAEIEEKVKSIRLMIVGLENQRQKLKTRANQHHDRLVHRLPPEIAAMIFELCIPEDMMDVIESEEEEEEESPKYPILTPLVISAVCEGWRSVAFSTPRLWNSLPIYPRSLRSPVLVKDWIDRSGQLPLSFLIHLPSGNEETAIDIIDILTKYSTRWSELRCNVPKHLFSHLPNGFQDLPMLRSLHLHSLNGDFSNIPLDIHPQQLHELSLREIALASLHFDWTRLTHFTIDDVTLSEAFEVLLRAPNLKKCIFHDFTSSDSDDNEAELLSLTNPFVRSQLHEIKIPLVLADYIFKQLRCPSLNVLDSRSISHDDVSAVLEFLKESKCPLETLSLPGDVYMPAAEMISICESIPTLKHLSMGRIDEDDDGWDTTPVALCNVLSRMSKTYGKTEPSCLPSLRSISFEQYGSHAEVFRRIPNIFGWYTLPECPLERLYHRHALKSVTVLTNPDSPESAIFSLSGSIDEIDAVTLQKIVQLRKDGINLTLQYGVMKEDLIELAATNLGISLA
ncbi:hypothetical protein BDN70DRAFT_721423 [Pholiota conissans]|uniref:F-box domain-containing protein n=1 Tax=Pholiota conissans TaxID=109636 RepID=A0A9P5Z2H3_9AGAR|nr:hypothetical protein BDN70DRAFT_721423 [Pholiota conissans]